MGTQFAAMDEFVDRLLADPEVGGRFDHAQLTAALDVSAVLVPVDVFVDLGARSPDGVETTPMTIIPHHRFDGPDDAPVLVLSNSLGTDLHMWDPQMEVLTRRHRVLRYDQRGHGQSPTPPGPYSIDELADDVVALRASRHRKGVVLRLVARGHGGHGPRVGEPERIDRFVACCTSARLGPPDLWHDRAALVRAEWPR